MTPSTKMRRSRLRVVAAGICIGLWGLAAIIVVGRRGDAKPVLVAVEQTLTIEAPEVVAAGAGFPVVVNGATGPVELTIDDGYGPRRMVADVSVDGVADFVVEPAEVAGGGLVVLQATAPDGWGQATVEAIPGEAVDAIDVYLGPRTVVADGVDFSMAVAVPTDAAGNPVVTGTPVEFLATNSERGPSTLAAATQGLLAYVDVVSGTVAGPTTVGARVADAQGPERSFLEVAGEPSGIEVSVNGPVPVADGASLVEVRTGTLVDEFANIVPDGTFAYLDADGATGRRRINGSSIDGIVTFVVEAPDRPGVATFTAVVGDASSEPLEIDFPAAVVELPVVIQPDGDAVRVVVSRVTATDGAYVPDGTIAEVMVGVETYRVELELGRGELSVDPTSDPISVTVLGQSATSLRDLR